MSSLALPRASSRRACSSFPSDWVRSSQGNLGALYTSDGTYALATYDDLQDAYQAQLRGVDIDERTAAMEDILVGHYEMAGFI